MQCTIIIKICADYISGWHTGIVKYYNRKLDKYLLGFDDGSSDLISEEDIDGVEMKFVDESISQLNTTKVIKQHDEKICDTRLMICETFHIWEIYPIL